MNFQDAQIGMQVVRSKGDYVVGRIGEIIAKDENKNRVQVSWEGNNKTWVSINAVEPTYIPYEIILPDYNLSPWERKNPKWPTYKRK